MLRRRLVKRSVVLGWESLARGDYDATLVAFGPDYEFNLFGDRFKALGFESRFVGRSGLIEFNEAWRAAWSSIEYEIEQVIDLGDQIVTRFTTVSRGAASGAKVRQTAGSVHFLVDATIVRMDFYWDWADCAAAVLPDQRPVEITGT
jgi:ketosteroid isomerase-like protein